VANKIRWSPHAVANFENICKYIAKDSIYYSAITAKKINEIVKSIGKFPKSGRIVPEYNEQDLREKIYKSYRIIYRIKDDFIEIVAIYHSAQLLNLTI